jgi:two-component system cell cycle sensor histidine kinase/response regulator CckA
MTPPLARLFQSRLLPVAVWVAGIAASVLLWQVERRDDRRQTAIFASRQASSIAASLARVTDRFTGLITGLVRQYGAGLKAKGGGDVQFVGLEALLWIGPDGRAEWVIPRAPHEALLGADFSHSAALRRAASTGAAAVSPAMNPAPQDSRIEIAAPVQDGGATAGFLLGIFSVGDVYRDLLSSPDLAAGWNVQLLDGAREVHRRGEPGGWLAEADAPGTGLPLRVRVAPGPEILRQLDSSLPRVTLAAGLAISFLLAAAVALAQSLQKGAQRLRDSEQRYRRFFESDLAGAVVTDVEGHLLDANPAALRLLGLESVAAFQGRVMSSLYARAEHRAKIVALIQSGSLDQVEVELRRDDGRARHVLSNFIGRSDERGVVTEIHCFLFDVTDKKRVELQLRQSQKMDAIGRLAGGVAHDFNNLLGVITGYGELLERDVPPGHPAMRRVREIRRAAESAATLTRQLLTFSRQQSLETRVFDLNEVVVEVEKMLRRLLSEDVRVSTALSPDLGKVCADSSQVEQIIMNLAINARDAMPNGGALIFETANVVLDRIYTASHPGVTEGDYVMLAVSDTGHGMDSETMAHIFEPFFTTKEKGKGTGLGLATVYGIVQQSGGSVNVYSEPGHGTSFKVYLPRVPESAPSSRPAVTETAPPRGSETVLLVEDSDSLRAMIREVLEASGYVVVEAGTADGSLAAVRERGPGIDLLLTDVIMPGLSGPDLAARLRATNPHARILYISGYTDEMIGSRGRGLGPGMQFLQKPFTFDALLRKVRESLDVAR